MALELETYGDLINLALKNAGVTGVGQTPTAEDANDACMLLNGMLGQWQRRRYLVYHLVQLSVTCTGAQFYTIGPGGDFDFDRRPASIKDAFARQVISSNPNQIDYPIVILPAAETYDQIALKTLNAFPQWAWYDAAFPLGKLYVYPVITSQFQLFIRIEALLQKVTSLTDEITMPPEYVEAVLYNLAVRLSGAYQVPLNPVVSGIAKAALETMRTVNAQIPRLSMPKGLTNPPRYNIFSDNSY